MAKRNYWEYFLYRLIVKAKVIAKLLAISDRVKLSKNHYTHWDFTIKLIFKDTFFNLIIFILSLSYELLDSKICFFKK